MPERNHQVNDLHQRSRILELTAPPPISLTRIAAEAGCSLSFVSACAHGRKKPTPRLMSAAERLLGVPASELFAPWAKGNDNKRSDG